VPIVGDIELFAREAQAPVAAITGTNGKSTVTTLVAHMAEAAGKRVLAGGNLGRPALELLEQPVPDLYVLELSSFQLDTTQSLHTAAATVLNVTPDHMDRYETLQDYAASKARIFAHCDAAIVNLDDVAVRGMTSGMPRVIGFSLVRDPAAHYYAVERDGDVALMHGDVQIALMSELKITGLHNAANALASLAMSEALGLPREQCVQTLRDFPGLPHRSQWVADVRGIRYVDDSKGTNVGATLAAVAGMPGSLVLIAGGQGKGQDFAPLAAAFRNKVRHVVLLGQDAQLIGDVLKGVCITQFARDMNEAVQLSAAAARPGETVLLSPACASLDMFRDYGHRGDVFAAAVRELSA
jgi:UDP-N-acetylmuramoylalanine--D-glutamate ligase